jgi:hypothetical protein
MLKLNGVHRPDTRLKDYEIQNGYRIGSKIDHLWIERACAKLNHHGIKTVWLFDGEMYYLNGSPLPCFQMVAASLGRTLRNLTFTRRL